MRRTAYFHCPSGKRAYRTEREAEKALDACRRKASQLKRQHVPRVLRAERRYYECDWCGAYHLTSTKERAA